MAPRTTRTARAKASLRATPTRTNRARGRKPVRPAAVRAERNTRAVKVKPLSRKDLAELKRLLEDERARLLEELEAMEEHTPEVEDQVGMDIGGGYDEDLADVASSTFEREKGLALESSVQQMLAQVEDALSRMADGTYGICRRCGDSIDVARLRVLPFATLCIRCKELEEKSNNAR